MKIFKRPEDAYVTEPWYDNTKLVAINTCPTWGVVRYGLRKTTAKPGSTRAMALEAGQTMHHVFAAVRIMDMLEHGNGFYPSVHKEEEIHAHAKALFGESQWEKALVYFRHPDNLRARAINVALSLIETSGFTDDPSDKKRTITNLEAAAILYIDRYEWNRWMPIWQEGLIGVETPFDLLVEINGAVRRFVGKIDGMVHDKLHNATTLHENKTSARLDRSWQDSFQMSHQVTGYMLAFEALTGIRVDHATIFGSAIPVPRDAEYGGMMKLSVMRTETQRREWFDWFNESAKTYERWLPEPENATKFTHSCNRYFRPCPLMSFCCIEPSERKEMLTEMADELWNPLEEGNT